MLNASQARTQAIANSEDKKVRIEAAADQIIANRLEPAIRDAVAEGKLSVALSMEEPDGAVANAVYEKLAAEGFDVSVTASAGSDNLGRDKRWFIVSWENAREGVPGKVVRPKTAKGAVA